MSKWLRVLSSALLAAGLMGWLITAVHTAAVHTAAVPPEQAVEWMQKVDPWVLETAVAGETEFLLYLSEQADLSGAASLNSKEAKGAYVYAQLTAVAQRTQPAVIAQLDTLGVPYRRYWVANMIWVRGDRQVIAALASRPDVAHLYANPTVAMPPLPTNEPLPEQSEAVGWNIALVNADDVWALGYTGQNIVIGGQDTGYDWSHVALVTQYRGWNGSSANHNYNWHDAIRSGNGGVCGLNSPVPCDDNGHGTHTMGTMLGNDMDPSNPSWPAGAVNAVGMAPGAKWIGCRNMDVGYGTPATYSECYQWFIAPYPIGGDPFNDGDPSKAPHVINNSWGCPPSEGCTDPNVLLSIVQAVRAAGIVTVHAAGNSGPGCSTVVDPATIYAESFSVGSTTNTDAISSFSSRGPVTIDGSNRLKPDISAPGSSIRSTLRNNTYGTLSGTSMAAPHVAGLVALVISANPQLAGNVDLIEQIIRETAVPLTSGQTCGGVPGSQIPNNTFGWGRINALTAVQHALDLIHRFSISKTASAAIVSPGDLLTYTITITHHATVSPTSNVVLTDALPADTSFVTATAPFSFADGVVTWQRGSMAPGESWSVQFVVQIDANATEATLNERYAVQSDQVTAVFGAPVITPLLLPPAPHTLSLNKTAVPAALYPGDLLTYTLVVTHLHTLSATTNLILTDTLPQHTSLVTATQPFTQAGNLITWHAPTLGPTQTWQVTLVVQVAEDNATLSANEIVNADYGVRSDQVAYVPGSPVSTPLLPTYQMTLHASAPPTIQPGHLLTYTFLVANPHPTNALSNLVLSSTLPAQTSFVTATLPFTLTDGVITWPLATLPAGESWQVEMVVQVAANAAGIIENAIYGARSDEVGPISGPPLTTLVSRFARYLPLILLP